MRLADFGYGLPKSRANLVSVDVKFAFAQSLYQSDYKQIVIIYLTVIFSLNGAEVCLDFSDKSDYAN